MNTFSLQLIQFQQTHGSEANDKKYGTHHGKYDENSHGFTPQTAV
jgi:hypothetical protein